MLKKFMEGIDPVLVVWLILTILACIALELISPTPKEVPAEFTAEQNEVVEVQAVQTTNEEISEVEEVVTGDTVYMREPEYYEALDLLAHLIYSEVGSDGEESMWLAGSVVINRINNSEYPDDLWSVVYQKGQYEVTWNGGLYKEEPNDIAYEVAAELLNSGSITPSEVIFQAEFTQGSGVYDKIGNTYYCYE